MGMITMSTNHAFFVLFSIILIFSHVQAQLCKRSGTLIGKEPPPGECDSEESGCCVAGKSYPTYKCSPPISASTPAILTLNNFESGGDGGGESQCDEKFHSNNTPVVALSTGWYNNGKNCLRYIHIKWKGKSVKAKVVDQCDSTMGCDEEHGYQRPCDNNIVDGSPAVWKALGVPKAQWGDIKITWSLA